MKDRQHIVVYDHFDSFTYNLVTLFEMQGAKVTVLRTNIVAGEIKTLAPTHLVLSPGYGHPAEIAAFFEALSRFRTCLAILGVCLGHQVIGLHCGAEIRLVKPAMHGKISLVTHDGEGLFKGIPNPFRVCRYHSWAINEESIGAGKLAVSARSDDGVIMGVRSLEYPRLHGVQFHPESLFTEYGAVLAGNFLSI